MSYLDWCWTIIAYVGMTLCAIGAVVVGFGAIGFVVMGIVNLVDEFRAG
ncbi:hypothetical protein [Mycobacterium paragordonae]|nr:hypothetical protein [Mycobacterium paragordonae]